MPGASVTGDGNWRSARQLSATHLAATDITARELRWMPLTDGAFLVVAVACIWMLPSGHPLRPGMLAVALIAYVVGTRITVPLGSAFGGATQAAFIVLLFAAPLNLVPALAFLATFAGALIGACRSGRWSQLLRCGGDCWFTIPPTLVLALAAPGPPSFGRWPVYAVAFAAQFVVGTLVAAGQTALVDETLPWSSVFLCIGLDTCLVPPGLIIAQAAETHALAAALALAGLTGIFAVVSGERRRSVRHARQALHDPLSGLANRFLFESMLATAAARAQQSGRPGAVILVDLDDFKSVNDRYGHSRGDQVLRAVAARMSSIVRRNDVLARLGGDEFAVLIADQDDNESALDRLRAAFARPLELADGFVLRVNISAGIAWFAGPEDAAAVLAVADEAMYANKRDARTRPEAMRLDVAPESASASAIA